MRLLFVILLIILSSCSRETIKQIPGKDMEDHKCEIETYELSENLWRIRGDSFHDVWMAIPKKMAELQASGITIFAKDVNEERCQLDIHFEVY